MMATDLPPEKVAEIHDIFKMFDTDDSGDIDTSELKVCISIQACPSIPNPLSRLLWRCWTQIWRRKRC